MINKFSNPKKIFTKRGLSAQKGFIKMTLIIVAALVLIKYIYDIDVVGFLTEGKFREILDKVYGLATQGWERYKDTLVSIWNYLVGLVKKSG